MKIKTHAWFAALPIALGLSAQCTIGGITNTVPWSESFESFTNGMAIGGTHGWTADPAAAVIKRDATVTDLLTNYPSAGRDYPLPQATHAAVLQVSALVSNDTRSVTNGVVSVDFMAMPEWMTVMPVGDPAAKFGFCVSTNGKVVVWYRDTVVLPATNRWLELSRSPIIPSNEWSRFTVLQDFSNHVFQIRVNEAAALTDASGWTCAGGVPDGPWFQMVQTNPALTRLVAAGACSYLDDVVVTRRSLSWSRANFSEGAAHDGTVDTASPPLITLSWDTFTGSVGDDLVAQHKLVVAGVPSNLTAMAVLTSTTQVEVSFSGQASLHAAIDSTDLTFQFQDSAFAMGRASDVDGSVTNGFLTFLDTPVLSYGSTVFTESPGNQGMLQGTSLSLVHGTFAATNGEDLVASGKVTVSNLPSGLTMRIICAASAQEAVVSFTGQATAHAVTNSLSDLRVAFLDAAFVGGYASAVVNATVGTLQIQFIDARSIQLSGLVFTEQSAGVIDNRHPITITLSGDTFTGADGSDFVAAGKVTLTGPVPAGLTAQVTRDSATRLSIRLLGAAVANEPADSVDSLILTLLDGAFAAGEASLVENHETSGVGIDFISDSGFFNVVPYVEPFESYPTGTLLSGTNGWTAVNRQDACVVTNDPLVASNLLRYVATHQDFPVSGTHTQLLFVQDAVKTELHSEAAGRVVLDFMALPVPLQTAEDGDTNRQLAFYISTNGHVVIWHRDMTGGLPVNRWLTLSDAGPVSTSEWVRFTVTQDYTTHMFQIQVNEGAPITSVSGWSQPEGGSTPGPWFHMVQTNGAMTAFGLSGFGDGFLDDVTVRFSVPDSFGPGRGCVFTYR